MILPEIDLNWNREIRSRILGESIMVSKTLNFMHGKWCVIITESSLILNWKTFDIARNDLEPSATDYRFAHNNNRPAR